MSDLLPPPKPAGPKKQAPERRCIVTGETGDRGGLIRFVAAPDGQVLADLAAKLPGRGVWVRADRAAVDLAVKRHAFARGLKAEARAAPGLADDVERLLARRCLELLGLGKRAGALAMGFDQVDAAIRAGPVYGLIEASDGAADGREKLQRLFFGRHGRPVPLAGCFTAEEIGVALGRDHVVHACWLQERMADTWAVEIGRLSGFRAITPPSWRPDLSGMKAGGHVGHGDDAP